MSTLFDGNGNDVSFLAVRDQTEYADIRQECESLWEKYRDLASPDFVNQFSCNFESRFWEMYLGTLLKRGHQGVASQSKGPDFKVVDLDGLPVYVEVTVATRGIGPDAVPDISKRCPDDDSVVSSECVLRITNSLQKKAESNGAQEVGMCAPYLIAVNLPYPEAWICSDPPLAAQACLGMSGLYLVKESSDSWYKFAGQLSAIKKTKTSEIVETTAFLDKKFQHVSAIIVASVNPFSSSYANPGFELLHNPNAIRPLGRGWFGIGREYWLNGNALMHSAYSNI